jgi:hypothetical protein
MQFITDTNPKTEGASLLDKIGDEKETIQHPEKISGLEIIDGRHFIFDHDTSRVFAEAKMFCKGKEISECTFIFKKINKISVSLLFPLGFNGRLYEPQNEIFYGKVVKAFEKKYSLNNRGFWIGAKYGFGGSRNGDFRYISSKGKTMKTVPLGKEFCIYSP